MCLHVLYPLAFRGRGGGGTSWGDFIMSDVRVCATDQGRFFTSKNPEQALMFKEQPGQPGQPGLKRQKCQLLF